MRRPIGQEPRKKSCRGPRDKPLVNRPLCPLIGLHWVEYSCAPGQLSRKLVFVTLAIVMEGQPLAEPLRAALPLSRFASPGINCEECNLVASRGANNYFTFLGPAHLPPGMVGTAVHYTRPRLQTTEPHQRIHKFFASQISTSPKRVESKTRTYHGRVGARRRTAGWPGKAGRGSSGRRPNGSPRSVLYPQGHRGQLS